MTIACSIASWNCADQSVFLRADLNVPLAHGAILNDRRLVGIQKTLDTLIAKDAIVILASHIGRPKDHEPELSTRQLIPWFEQKGYTIRFCETIEDINQHRKNAPVGSILLLENLRFFPGEKKRDTAFIHALRSTAEWYVNDAFGTLHRNDASLAALANAFPAEKRSIGYLVEKELNMLNELLHNAQPPVCIIVGGGKVADKLPLIKNLISIADYILVCPALSSTFAVAQHEAMGKSLVDYDAINIIHTIQQQATEKHVSIVLPTDYQIASGSLDGPLSYVASDVFPKDGYAISIGPKTLAEFHSFIKKSGTLFCNGMVGFSDRPETLEGFKKLLTDIAESDGKSIIAGGDSIAIADEIHLTGITYYSTGGGATLTYLSGKQLPGLQPFLKHGAKTN